jgi:FlaG/FlaF family flagellin (archaellin)
MKKDSRGVSPVVSVTLTVAITILLAAVVSASVLSLGGSTSEETPSVSFSVDQEGDQLIVTHAAGDTIDTSDLRLTGVKGWGSSAQEFTAGDRISAGPAPGAERVDIVFETEDSSSVLRTVDVSNMEVSSLVVNDWFERGSGFDAESWEQAPTLVNFEDKVERTDERSLSGEDSIKQVSVITNYEGRTIISESIDISSDQNYEFGGSHYLSDPGPNATATGYRYGVRVKWLDSEGTEIDTYSDFEDFSTSGQWSPTTRFSARAPSNATAARLVFESKQSGADNPTDVYWDEAFIEPAD